MKRPTEDSSGSGRLAARPRDGRVRGVLSGAAEALSLRSALRHVDRLFMDSIERARGSATRAEAVTLCGSMSMARPLRETRLCAPFTALLP